MNQRITVRAIAALAIALPACGGPTMSGVAVGRVGHGLSMHAQSVPRGAEVCAMQDALAGSGAASEKPASEACARAAHNDLLWRRAMKVLAAYGATLEALAMGSGNESAGPVEGALSGVRSGEWIEVEGAAEKSARDAASQLATKLAAGPSDLGALIKDASPNVKTLCDGLAGYLDAQGRGLAEVHKDIEKKRASRTDRRCGALDSRPVCVSESVIDRMVYAQAFGQVTILEAGHVDAHNAVTGFCAAHKKLEEAANDGRLGKDRTTAEVVEAVKSAPRAMSTLDKGGGAAPAKKK